MNEDLINAILDSEFEEVNGLLGMDEVDQIGAFFRRAKANPILARKAQKVLARTAKPVAAAPGSQQTSRDQIMKRFNKLKPDLKGRLLKGSSQLADTALYNVKSISGATSIDVFTDDDNKIVGLRNISAGKLEKDEVFMMSGISVMYGVGAGTTDTHAKATEFGALVAALRNGEFELKVAGEDVIPRCSMEIFRSVVQTVNATTDQSYGYAYGSAGMIGYYKLDNPKMIPSQKTIEMNIKWGTAAASNAFIKVILHGTRVI